MIEAKNHYGLHKMKMTALLLFLVSNAYYLYAQERTTKSPRFFSKIEIQGGPGLSFLRGNPGVDNNSINKKGLKLGYAYGIGFVQQLSPKFDIRYTFLIDKKGGVVDSDNIYFDELSQSFKQGQTNEEYKYDYYSLPMIVGYSFGRRPIFQVGLGPFVSYLDKQIVVTIFTPQNRFNTEDQTSFNRKFDFGLASRFSLSIPVDNWLSINANLLNLWGVANTRALENYGVIRTFSTNFLLGIVIGMP